MEGKIHHHKDLQVYKVVSIYLISILNSQYNPIAEAP